MSGPTVTDFERPDSDVSRHEGRDDADFWRAVDLLDAGDVDGLRTQLASHPDLVRRRLAFEGTPARAMRRTAWWLAALSLVVYVFTGGGSMTSTDAVVAFDLTTRMVDARSVALSGDLLGSEAFRGADGQYYSPFGVAQSIYNIPFYVTGKLVNAALPRPLGKPDSVPKAVVTMSQSLIVAAIVFQIFRFGLLVAAPGPSLMAALTCAFGSLLWPYASFGFNQPLAALAVLSSTYLAVRGTREGRPVDLVWSGVWLGIGLLTRHEIALAAIPIALWLLAGPPASHAARWKRMAAFAPGVIVATGVWLVYNFIRFGNALDSGYLRDPVPRFWSPITDGIGGLLFSPAASVLLYSPFVVFGAVGLGRLWRRDRGVAIVLGALSVGALVFYASLGNWVAGRAYGSRYLVVILPLLGIGWAVFLDRLTARARTMAFAVVLIAGFCIQLPGVFVDYAKVSQAFSIRDGAIPLYDRQWAWRASGLKLNTTAFLSAVPENVAYVTGKEPPPPLVTTASVDDRSFSQQFAFSLDAWWLYLHYLGALSRFGVLLVVAIFCGAIAYGVRGLSRAYAETLGDGSTTSTILPT